MIVFLDRLRHGARVTCLVKYKHKNNGRILCQMEGFIWSAALRQWRAQLSKGTLFSATRALVPRCFLPSVP